MCVFLEYTNWTSLRVVGVFILDDCFGARLSVFESSLVVLGGIFSATEERMLSFSFNNLNLTVVEPQSPVLTSTPQSKIQSILEENCVKECQRNVVSQDTSAPQLIFFLWRKWLCLTALGSKACSFQPLHFGVKDRSELGKAHLLKMSSCFPC